MVEQNITVLGGPDQAVEALAVQLELADRVRQPVLLALQLAQPVAAGGEGGDGPQKLLAVLGVSLLRRFTAQLCSTVALLGAGDIRRVGEELTRP